MLKEKIDMLIVYEHNESVCCQKVRLTLEEKSIEHEVRNVSFHDKETRKPAFLAINPKGVVPIIIHDGRVVNESTVITEYLDDAFPDPPLMPTEPYWRARRRLWARWIDDEMHAPHISTISFNISFTELLGFKSGQPSGAPKYFFSGIESDDMYKSLRAYQKFLSEMDKTLAENDWLAGSAYSLADIDVIPYVWRLKNLQLSGMWKKMPRIQEWVDRVTERPPFQRTIVNTMLPTWVASMKENGEKAWPTIERMLEL